ncbi:phosphoribosyltransferase [bacterium]|nr:phosphoribosyltransferase [bacterium]
MVTDSEALQILEDAGAFRAGHFVYTSGRHGDKYVNKDALYVTTREVSRLCEAMAARALEHAPEAVIGPAVGAAILAQWTAHHLSLMTGEDIAAVYADKDGQGGFVIKRGYDKVIKGKKVLVVEDLVTTGGSIKKVIDCVKNVEATIVGAIAICNRGGVTKKDISNPPLFEALVNVHLSSWEEKECELCKRGIPVSVDVGHGKDFTAKKK